MPSKSPKEPPWQWLAWFGLLHGLNEWLDLLAFSLGDSQGFAAFRLGLMVASFLPLAEFGRRGLARAGRLHLGPWILLLFCFLGSLGAIGGMAGMDAAFRYALVLPGSALAGWAILAGREKTKNNRARTVMGFAFFVYALAAGLVVPGAGFFPTSLLNGQVFLSIAGFPIQMIGAGCAAAAAFGAWLIGQGNSEPGRSSSLFRDRLFAWVLPLSVVLLLAAGFWIVLWRGQTIEARTRDNLSLQVASIARAINGGRIRGLSFTSDDARKPLFLRLQDEMTDYAKAAGIRRLFAVAPRNGALLVGPSYDSERNGKRLKLGDRLHDPPSELQKVLLTRRPSIAEQPAAEGAGTIAAFAPVLDRRSGEPLMAIVMETDGAKGHSEILRERFAIIVFILCLSLTLLAGTVALDWRARLPARAQKRLKGIEVALVVLVGLIITTFLVRMTDRIEDETREKAFAYHGKTAAENVAGEMEKVRDLYLPGLVAYYQQNKKVTKENFRFYSKTLLGETSIAGMGWAPRVAYREKDIFERRMRREGTPGFSIFWRSRFGENGPPAKSDEFFPLCFVEPYDEIVSAIGFDIKSDPNRWKAAQTAIVTGLPTGTEVIRRISNNEPAINVYAPVLADASSVHHPRGPEVPLGVVYVTVRLADLLATALHVTPFVPETEVVELYELQAGTGPRFLASSPPDAGGQDPRALERDRGKAQGLLAPLFVFGHTYAILTRPGLAFTAAHPRRSGFRSAFTGLLVTAVLALLIGVINNRRLSLEEEVRQRTLRAQRERRILLSSDCG